LGSILLEEELISQDQLDSALAEQTKTGEKLGTVLSRLGFVDEDAIARILGQQLDIDHVTSDQIPDIDPQLTKLIPEHIARKYSAIAVGEENNRLQVAMADPFNLMAIDDLRRITSREISPLIGPRKKIEGAIDRFYSQTQTGQGLETAVKDLSGGAGGMGGAGEKAQVGTKIVTEVDTGQEATVQDDAPIVNLVNRILSQGAKDRASDIHLEPTDHNLQIRIRIDGLLHEIFTIDKHQEAAVITRIKVLSGMDIDIDLRVSTLPIVFGEKIVIRLSDKEALNKSLEDLGFEPSMLKAYEKQVKRPYGMVLVTGPTGSGKSTTLYASLNKIKTSEKNIVTIEDPVEATVEGIHQVQTNAKAGLTFSVGLRSILRQDPNIVMVGEIRDQETAVMAIRAALTGHLVLSTIHANDAVSTVIRLTNMGIEPYLVASAVNCILAQRLVRRICNHCKESYTATPEILKSLKTREKEGQQVTLHQGKGCDQCRGTGYLGRVALYEILIMTQKLRDLVLKNPYPEELRVVAVEEGMVSLFKSGLRKVLQGVTTVEEVLAAAVND
jgi:type IV pilus assembly protein PilB